MGRKKKNNKEYEDDVQDIRKSYVRQNKLKKHRKKNKQDLNWLIEEDKTSVEDYYDYFEKW